LSAKLLAAALKDRSAHKLIVNTIDKEALTSQFRILLEHVTTYYDSDPEAFSVDTDILKEDVVRNLNNPKHESLFVQVLESAEGMDVSASNVVRAVVEEKKKIVGNELANSVVSGATERKVRELISSYVELLDSVHLEEEQEEKEQYKGIDLEYLLFEKLDRDNLIKVAPKQLNDRLNGGALRGNHLLIVARPEVGKTALAITMIWAFLLQGLKVLYIGNEDPLAQVLVRIASCITGMTQDAMMKEVERARELLSLGNHDNLVMEELTPGTLKQVDDLTEKHEPDVLIVDQLRNLRASEEGLVSNLEQAARGVRDIGKKRKCLAVSVTQAGGSAENKLVLDMGDIDSSKTGIPGAVDVIIGFGANETFKNANMRMISLSKNKLGGVHDHFEVQIDPTTSRIT